MAWGHPLGEATRRVPGRALPPAAKPPKKTRTARHYSRRPCHQATANSPAPNETKVPSRVGGKMSAALKPAIPLLHGELWRMAMTVVGIRAMPAVLR